MLLLLPLLLFYLSRRRRWTGNRESKKERKKESGREREIVSRLSHVPRLPPRTIVLDSIRVRCLSGAARRGAGGRRRRGEGKSSEKEREKDGARIRGTAPFFNHAYPRYNIISTVWPPPPSSSPSSSCSSPAQPPYDAARDLSRGFLSVRASRGEIHGPRLCGTHTATRNDTMPTFRAALSFAPPSSSRETFSKGNPCRFAPISSSEFCPECDRIIIPDYFASDPTRLLTIFLPSSSSMFFLVLFSSRIFEGNKLETDRS